jgi:hypothetical protein
MSIRKILLDKNYINVFKSTNIINGSSLNYNEGSLEWSNSISAKQKDIFLNKDTILLNVKNKEYLKLDLPLHKDGSFQLEDEEIYIHIKYAFFYTYENSKGHLPFYISCKKNDEEVYLNLFGNYDKINEINKISDYFSIKASNKDTIQFYIRKKFNDVGDIELKPLSYISYEVL